MNEFSQEELLLNMGSSKDKHGVRERFAKEKFFIREEWLFPDKGILTNNDNIPISLLSPIKISPNNRHDPQPYPHGRAQDFVAQVREGPSFSTEWSDWSGSMLGISLDHFSVEHTATVTSLALCFSLGAYSRILKVYAAWSKHAIIDRQTDRQIDWLIDWLSDWLID